jgi:hypothetical protein
MLNKLAREMKNLSNFVTKSVKLIKNIAEIKDAFDYDNLSLEEKESFKKSITPRINDVKQYLKEFKLRVKV